MHDDLDEFCVTRDSVVVVVTKRCKTIMASYDIFYLRVLKLSFIVMFFCV